VIRNRFATLTAEESLADKRLQVFLEGNAVTVCADLGRAQD